jgi:hypothetical protein
MQAKEKWIQLASTLMVRSSVVCIDVSKRTEHYLHNYDGVA